jgi:anaerobic magnesium-protoporphyrin IX monomethyl ester cyclase
VGDASASSSGSTGGSLDNELSVRGVNTRVTPILRDEEYLPLRRRAGLIHILLGTETASQPQLNSFHKATTIAQDKRAVERLRKHGLVSGAWCVVGLENETRQALEETHRTARDWNSDMANRAMYRPRPVSDLGGATVDVHDFAPSNFVTPIIKPDARHRTTLLDDIRHKYRRFDTTHALLAYRSTGKRQKRRYRLSGAIG